MAGDKMKLMDILNKVKDGDTVILPNAEGYFTRSDIGFLNREYVKNPLSDYRLIVHFPDHKPTIHNGNINYRGKVEIYLAREIHKLQKLNGSLTDL